MSEDQVNHPKHYASLNPEPIDVIEAWGLCFHLGSALKYLARHDRKGSPITDLRKAAWYINRKADILEKQRKEEYLEANAPKPKEAHPELLREWGEELKKAHQAKANADKINTANWTQVAQLISAQDLKSNQELLDAFIEYRRKLIDHYLSKILSSRPLDTGKLCEDHTKDAYCLWDGRKF